MITLYITKVAWAMLVRSLSWGVDIGSRLAVSQPVPDVHLPLAFL